jgi:hypothetical protein
MKKDEKKELTFDDRYMLKVRVKSHTNGQVVGPAVFNAGENVKDIPAVYFAGLKALVEPEQETWKKANQRFVEAIAEIEARTGNDWSDNAKAKAIGQIRFKESPGKRFKEMEGREPLPFDEVEVLEAWLPATAQNANSELVNALLLLLQQKKAD